MGAARQPLNYLENKINRKVKMVIDMRFINEKEELINDEVFMKMQKIAEKYGYQFYTAINRVHDTGFIMPYAVVNPKDNDSYHPGVSYCEEGFMTGKYRWEIDTVSYGSLEPEEYEKFMKETMDAYNFVKEISEISQENWPAIKVA